MKTTLNDAIGFCLYMIDKIADVRDNTTDEIVKIKDKTTYTTMLQHILDDDEDEVNDWNNDL